MTKPTYARTNCRFCGGTVSVLTADPTSDMRAHMLSVEHRRAMQPQTVVKRVDRTPYPEPDSPYAEQGPMKTLLRGAVCQGCRQKVDVVRYLDGVHSVHPNGSLACRD